MAADLVSAPVITCAYCVCQIVCHLTDTPVWLVIGQRAHLGSQPAGNCLLSFILEPNNTKLHCAMYKRSFGTYSGFIALPVTPALLCIEQYSPVRDTTT